MGIFWNLFRKAMPPDMKQMVAWIEKEVEAGRMSRAEADRRMSELEQDLHKIFDAQEAEDKKES